MSVCNIKMNKIGLKTSFSQIQDIKPFTKEVVQGLIINIKFNPYEITNFKSRNINFSPSCF